jgi:hypothetical protein
VVRCGDRPLSSLSPFVAQLDDQDRLDTQLLSNKTAIHAAAAAVVGQVNATLDANVDTFTTADATCQAKTTSVDNDKASHEQDVLHCDSELTYISTMKDAMANLKETGEGFRAGTVLTDGHATSSWP